MRVREVVILREVADDLNDGKAFYDQREPGVGDYFWDSLFADIDSLMIYAGIHSRTKVSTECLPNGFHMPSIMKSRTKLLMSSRSYPCGVIQRGSKENWKAEADPHSGKRSVACQSFRRPRRAQTLHARARENLRRSLSGLSFLPAPTQSIGFSHPWNSPTFQISVFVFPVRSGASTLPSACAPRR